MAKTFTIQAGPKVVYVNGAPYHTPEDLWQALTAPERQKTEADFFSCPRERRREASERFARENPGARLRAKHRVTTTSDLDEILNELDL